MQKVQEILQAAWSHPEPRDTIRVSRWSKDVVVTFNETIPHAPSNLHPTHVSVVLRGVDPQQLRDGDVDLTDVPILVHKGEGRNNTESLTVVDPPDRELLLHHVERALELV